MPVALVFAEDAAIPAEVTVWGAGMEFLRCSGCHYLRPDTIVCETTRTVRLRVLFTQVGTCWIECSLDTWEPIGLVQPQTKKQWERFERRRYLAQLAWEAYVRERNPDLTIAITGAY